MVVPNRPVEYCGICEIMSQCICDQRCAVRKCLCELLKNQNENVANKIQTFLSGKNLKMNNEEERGGDIKESSSPRIPHI